MLDKLIGKTFTTVVYSSVVGNIEIETDILMDGTISSTIWVCYPDGFSDEVLTVQEAIATLELD